MFILDCMEVNHDAFAFHSRVFLEFATRVGCVLLVMFVIYLSSLSFSFRNGKRDGSRSYKWWKAEQ